MTNNQNKITLSNLSFVNKVRMVVPSALYTIVGVCVMFPLYAIGLALTSLSDGYEKKIGRALSRYQIKLWKSARKESK